MTLPNTTTICGMEIPRYYEAICMNITALKKVPKLFRIIEEENKYSGNARRRLRG